MAEAVIDARVLTGVVATLEREIRRLRDLLRAPARETGVSEHLYIEKIPTVLSGEPIIKGTRTSVRAVVEYWKFGASPEEIAEKLPHLRLAQIFDVLSYYDDHRDEIEGHIARNRIPVDDE